jgi:hypothetical protein
MLYFSVSGLRDLEPVQRDQRMPDRRAEPCGADEGDVRACERADHLNMRGDGRPEDHSRFYLPSGYFPAVYRPVATVRDGGQSAAIRSTD